MLTGTSNYIYKQYLILPKIHANNGFVSYREVFDARTTMIFLKQQSDLLAFKAVGFFNLQNQLLVFKNFYQGDKLLLILLFIVFLM